MTIRKATEEDAQAVKPAASQDSILKIRDEAIALTDKGLSDNDTFDVLKEQFELVQDGYHWKKGSVVITDDEGEAAKILASFMWYHDTGNIVALKTGEFMVFSHGYNA